MTALDFGRLLEEAKTASFDVLPDGDYPVVIEEASARDASTNKPMVVVKARITDGPHAKRVINNNFVLSEDNPVALAIFFRHMAAMGIDASFFAGLGTNTLDPVAAALVNRRCIFTLGRREWPVGQVPPAYRNQVNGVKPLTGVPAGVGAPIGPAPGQAIPAGIPGVPSGLPQMPPAPAPVPTPAVAAPAPAPVPPPAAPPTPASIPTPPPPIPALIAPQPAPAPAPAPSPVAPPAPAPAPAEPVDTPVPGYETIWSTLPQAAKDAIRATAAVAQQPPALAPAAAPAPPPPPTLPV